ncbi:MAG: T9SS type A sorting domain-containing protein [Bacteroidia bacterium]
MKKITTLLAAIFVAACITPNAAHAQSCPWAKRTGGNNDDMGTAVATDASGNVYHLGNFYSATIAVTGTNTLTVNLTNEPAQAFNYGAEMFLAKYDSCGNLKWAKKAGGKSETYGSGLVVDALGNIYVTGYTSCDTVRFGATTLVTSNANNDVFLVKYNNSGVAQWAVAGTGNDDDMATAIAIDGSNNLYITGSFVSTSLTFGANSILNGTNDQYVNDIFIAKFDNSGNNLWVRGNTSNSTTSYHALAFAVGADAAGNVYVGGRFGSSYLRFNNDSVATTGNSDLYLVKYDANGNYQWVKATGSSFGNNDCIYGLACSPAGEVTVTGYLGKGSTTFGLYNVSSNSVNRSFFTAQYNTNGTEMWAHGSRGDYYSDNFGTAVSLDGNGDVYVSGTFSSDSLNIGPVTLMNFAYADGSGNGGGDYYYDILTAKYHAGGALMWARGAGGDSTEIANGIATGPHGALYTCGQFKSSPMNLAATTLTITPANSGFYEAFICNNIQTLPVTPEICLVSADTMWGGNEYNVVYWDKTPFSGVNKFIVLREVTSGVYKPIGSVPYNSLSMFIDTARSVGPANGNPLVGTYRYKIQILDTAGTFSYMSPYHNTVYFQNNSGTFNWNLYTVENMTLTPVTTFDLVRDNNATGSWQVISSIAGTQTSQTDPAYTTYSVTADWRVEANGFNCTPTFRLGHNNNQSAIIKSKSNISNNRGIGIANANAVSLLSVYPNPAKNNFTIETSSTDKQFVQVYDISGKVVLSQNIHGTTNVDASSLNDGVYYINITNNKNTVNKRLVIVK